MYRPATEALVAAALPGKEELSVVAAATNDCHADTCGSDYPCFTCNPYAVARSVTPPERSD